MGHLLGHLPEDAQKKARARRAKTSADKGARTFALLGEPVGVPEEGEPVGDPGALGAVGAPGATGEPVSKGAPAGGALPTGALGTGIGAGISKLEALV